MSAGYVEVVLTGVDLGHYGWDLGPAHDADRAGAAARSTSAGSPGCASRPCCPPTSPTELVELIVGERRICRHLHVPLQAGSDRVLRAMRRPYNGADVPRARRAPRGGRFPASGLGADVITGFPGETDADFDATEALVEALPFTYLHVFSYSDRRGTEAARGPAPACAPGTIRQRTARLRRLGAAKQLGVPPRPRSAASCRRSCSSTASERPGGSSVSPTTTWSSPSPGRTRSCAGSRASGRPARTGRDWKGRSSAMGEPRVGVIGGSGLYELEGLTDVRWHRVRTPFGDPSDAYCIGRLGDREVVFLPRHGRGHRLIPSELPFRANLYGMKALGVEWVISVSAVGSMRERIAPLDLVIPDQFYDHTKRRIPSFFEEGIVAHVSMADPVCPDLAAALQAASAETGATVHRGGTYICIEGPQFSTKAESRIYRSWGVDVIGMTNVPEVKLAREAELCYATLALVTDYDVWHETEAEVTVEAVVANLHEERRHRQERPEAGDPAAPRPPDLRVSGAPPERRHHVAGGVPRLGAPAAGHPDRQVLPADPAGADHAPAPAGGAAPGARARGQGHHRRKGTRRG